MTPAPDTSLRAAWEAQANAWAAWARTPGHDHFFWRYNLPTFLEIVPPPGSLTVDVGCGEGRVARVLTELGHHVVGVDGSPTLARLAATHEEPLATIAGDAAALPVRDATADIAVAFMSLSAYTEALGHAGFTIDTVREPVPDDDVLRDHPEMAQQRRIPTFLHLRAIKRPVVDLDRRAP